MGQLARADIKGTKPRLRLRCLSYSWRPGLKRPRPTTSFQNAPGSSKPTGRCCLAYVNANFVRDKVTLVYVRTVRANGPQWCAGRRGGEEAGGSASPFRGSLEMSAWSTSAVTFLSPAFCGRAAALIIRSGAYRPCPPREIERMH